MLARLEDRFETYGIDVSPFAVERARTAAPRSSVRVARAEEVGELPGPFDIIAAFHVVEHLTDPAAVLGQIGRMLAPRGLLIIATPNPEAPCARRKGPRWFGRRDPTHISLKPPAIWLELIRGAGLQVRKAFGDGLWDVPYVPVVPARLQLAVFGFPALVQTVTCLPFVPVRLSESLIVVAERS